MALLNTGAEINGIPKKDMKDAKLAMRQRQKLKLILHTKYSQLLLRLCDDVDVVIGCLKTRYAIFVIEAEDHNLVLEQPFLNAIKFSQDYKQNGVSGSITYPWTQELTLFQILLPHNPVNCIENHIFLYALN